MCVGLMVNFAWGILILLSTVVLAPYVAISIRCSFGIVCAWHMVSGRLPSRVAHLVYMNEWNG